MKRGKHKYDKKQEIESLTVLLQEDQLFKTLVAQFISPCCLDLQG
jgi:hypothetical protein